jgi:hypothetical protein
VEDARSGPIEFARRGGRESHRLSNHGRLVALVYGEFQGELEALLARIGSVGAIRFDLLCDQLPRRQER